MGAALVFILLVLPAVTFINALPCSRCLLYLLYLVVVRSIVPAGLVVYIDSTFSLIVLQRYLCTVVVYAVSYSLLD